VTCYLLKHQETTPIAPTAQAYLRNPGFDGFFTWGVPLVAALSVLIVLIRPDLFLLVLFLDLTLLGSHHVVATYTRVDFSSENAQQHLLLFVYAPVIVLVGVAATLALWGPVVITTIYLHWQWYHYTRQSEGVSKAYTFKSKSKFYGETWFNRGVFYAVPITAFLAMSARQPDQFLWSDVWTLAIPPLLANALFVLSLSALAFWMVVQIERVRAGAVAPLALIYFASHHFIYIFAYVVIKDINTGWLLINIWHNLQYIAFVWVCNVNQYGRPDSDGSELRKWLCAPQRWPAYFLACLAVSYVFYAGIDAVIAQFPVETAGLLFIIVYQSVNFHHYIVDSQIWKLRKKPVRQVVGIEK